MVLFLIPENAETKIPFSRDCSNMPVEIPNPKDEQEEEEEEEEEEEAACVARGRSFESFRNIFFLFFLAEEGEKGQYMGKVYMVECYYCTRMEMYVSYRYLM